MIYVLLTQTFDSRSHLSQKYEYQINGECVMLLTWNDVLAIALEL